MVRAQAVCLLLTLLLAGCSSSPRLVVGSKNFTEQVILGELIAQHIERRLGIEVERKLNLGGTMLAHEALKSGSLDLYPEYTGTALTAVLKQPVGDPASVLRRVREGYKGLGIEWLDPLGFNNTFAMVVRSETASRLSAPTLSVAAARKEAWKLGVGYEFVQRPDGLPGLARAYSLRVEGEPVTMDLGLLYSALENGQVEMVAANATDGVLAKPGFVVLADDRRFFPPYECAIAVRTEASRSHPRLREALVQLSGVISEEEMRKMNADADTKRRPIPEIVREFLGKH